MQGESRGNLLDTDDGVCSSAEGVVCGFTLLGDTKNRLYKLGHTLELWCLWPQM